MGWRLDAKGANAVLSSVQTHTDTMLTALGNVEGAVEGVAGATPGDVVIAALNELFSDLSAHAAVLQTRPKAAVQGVVNASKILDNAQSDMSTSTRTSEAAATLNLITSPGTTTSGKASSR